jgi:chaperone required for assembly of F1-ATPase
MRTTTTVSAAVAMLVAAGLSGPALAVNDAPLTEKWAPSEWGADDKAGAVNRTTAAMVLKAAKLVKQGKVATLGKVV